MENSGENLLQSLDDRGIIQRPKGGSNGLLGSRAFFTGRRFLDSRGKENQMNDMTASEKVLLAFQMKQKQAQQSTHGSEDFFHMLDRWAVEDSLREYEAWLTDVQADFDANVSLAQDRIESGLLS